MQKFPARPSPQLSPVLTRGKSVFKERERKVRKELPLYLQPRVRRAGKRKKKKVFLGNRGGRLSRQETSLVFHHGREGKKRLVEISFKLAKERGGKKKGSEKEKKRELALPLFFSSAQFRQNRKGGENFEGGKGTDRASGEGEGLT